MQNEQPLQTENQSSQRNTTTAARVPSISLPKGGGAIRGIGEKFAANLVTGTGSMSVPIATSLGRSGFGPQLVLSYDSGSGNGIFGFGWSLSLPTITRKTDKGLPRYLDAEESDVFILSGAEDLVPMYNADGSRFEDTTSVPGYKIYLYRPRIEGLFARIERWTNLKTGATHWRSISKDNISTLYGKDNNSRIVDPADSTPAHPSRIFSWLICETRDDKGNVISYEYKQDDGSGVDLNQSHERNRGGYDNPRRTVNRYLKRIYYGNRRSMLENGKRPFHTQAQNQPDWMFELVFDYGEHHADTPMPGEAQTWNFRQDAFSSYRSGFEIRTTRLCQRVLMFHHFPNETGVGANCLVKSTDFTYSHEQDPANAKNPVYSMLQRVHHVSYKRHADGYRQAYIPPLELYYSQPIVQDVIEEVDATSLDHLPSGLASTAAQWTDLHGEGIPGILIEQGNAWFYKRNVSPINANGDSNVVLFAPIELVVEKPNLALQNDAQFMDLAGDGLPDLVVFDDTRPGLYEHDEYEGWQPFRPFAFGLNRDMRDPNLRFIDLNGDGRADVLITEEDAFIWHLAEGEAGFGPAQRVYQLFDEEKGPHLIFADGTRSIYLADMNGDGLTDLVRIRNGEVCYWPNLGYGNFGHKVAMDNSPQFDNPDQFNQNRIRLADIDGTGTADIIYLHREGVHLYFNQSGNSWSSPQILGVFVRADDLMNIVTTDLLGNDTACIVWSSASPADANQPMRYINLMGVQKPHLLMKIVNNLGAETQIHYVPSTKFYLQDKRDGQTWITRLPFPVHVVERVETYDRISRNRFVTRYAYHHGYFDGEEREFRGFGMVEQWDTEEIGALTDSGILSYVTNLDAASYVPTVYTRTWFHTGVYQGRERISRQFEHEYYREPHLSDEEFHHLLLPDTLLPDDIAPEEEREACRALKGMMLRQEVYANDADANASPTLRQRAATPYTVAEQNFSVRCLQPRGSNRHGVFFSFPREAITYHYERKPFDPRIQHALTLDVDDFGNVLKSVAIGYGRRISDASLSHQSDREQQTRMLITYTENSFTNAVATIYDYRTPLLYETATHELTGIHPSFASRFSFDEWTDNHFALIHTAQEIPYEQLADIHLPQKRVIERICTVYRKDDLSAFLPFGELEALALTGKTYKLAFTPGLLAQIFQRDGEALLPDLYDVLSNEGGYVELDENGHWWIPSGQMFYSPDTIDNPAEELAYAREHFFLPHRYRDPFNQTTSVSFDAYNLLLLETRDALDNCITVGERNTNGTITQYGNDYRVLQPFLITDANRNRSAVVFDTLGMVAGVAVMGKLEENLGDSLDGFESDLSEDTILAHLSNPFDNPHALLGDASSRMVYDLFGYQRTQHESQPQGPVAYTMARETHVADLQPEQATKIQHSFSYSDGFGREIQKKIQAEPDLNDDNPRWVGSGWTIFNNKGKPVRQYEPFFSPTHRFEFGVKVGVSPILFYDPVGRVVATLLPNHTYEKVVFNPWRQQTWDTNDTITNHPQDDPHVGDYFRRLPDNDYLPTWYSERIIGELGVEEQQAAQKSATHANTATVTHFDSLGRTFLTVAHNQFERDSNVVNEFYETRVVLDIEGNQREIIDAQNRMVMRYDYDMLGTRLRQASMEAGTHWTLNDVGGKVLYTWDSRNHRFRTVYDALRRPTETYRRLEDEPEILVGRTIYGESLDEAESDNLRGKVYQASDKAGIVTTGQYDFKGNLLHSQRQLATEYHHTLDWLTEIALEDEVYESFTHYDALNRPIALVPPDRSIVYPVYNEANLLERVEVRLQDAETTTVFVEDIDYNAKGQRLQIVYGNGVSTAYTYDERTFRLLRLNTLRGNDESQDLLQDLHYTYDPVGNITYIHDAAQRDIFFRNNRVVADGDYTYDAVYQLIKATGREHLGQHQQQPLQPPNVDDAHRMGILSPSDGNAMGRYTEHYVYDAVGNILEMIHRSSDVGNAGWTQHYHYQEPSQLRPEHVSNRLSSTHFGNNPAGRYTYDAQGNMLTMPHLSLMRWDCANQLTATAQQAVNNGTPETTYYVYDAGGQRIRKVTERYAAEGQFPIRKAERIYLGGFEIYREYDGSGTEVTLERQTLHIMDDQQRVAIVETRTIGEDDSPLQLTRYQFSNHLGSTALELDAEAQIISYEEYYPYGGTSYQLVRNQNETPKRYRYTGKERDEETGLYYHGARYYAPWLGRWTSADPSGIDDKSKNLYEYVTNNPAIFHDPNGLDKEKAWYEHVGDFAAGVYEGGKDAVVGVKDLAVGAYNVSIINMFVDNEQWQKSNEKLANTVSTIVDNPKVVWDAIKTPYVKAWEEGRPGEAIGRGTLEVVTAVIGTKGLDKLAKASKVGKVAAVAGEAANVIGKTGEAANVIGKTGEAANVIGKTGEAANVIGKTGEAINIASKGEIPGKSVALAALRMTEKALKGRADELAKALEKAGLKPSWGTVGVLQGEVDGKVVTLVTANNKRFFEALKPLLREGEELVEPTFINRISEKTGRVLTGERQGIWVHAEQVLANEATGRGLKSSWVATSNNACPGLCKPSFGPGGDLFPDIKHVNPSHR